jgi:hypothetical protein
MTDILTRLAAITAHIAGELLPCSHCQRSQCSVYQNDYGRWLVGCGSCGSHTGTCKTKEDAVKLHNNRPHESALIALVQEAAGEIERLRNSLHEGLNLCVRARKLDESITAQTCRELGSYHPDHVKCGTPHLWVLEQYDNDLAVWERDARKTLNVQGAAS